MVLNFLGSRQLKIFTKFFFVDVGSCMGDFIFCRTCLILNFMFLLRAYRMTLASSIEESTPTPYE